MDQNDKNNKNRRSNRNLLGAAKLLMDNKDNLAGGKVKFMFQPGEEGHGGGHKMVEAGVLEKDKAMQERVAAL